MKKELLYGAVGLLAGIAVAWAAATVSVNNNYTGMMNMMGMNTKTDDQGAMNHGMTMDDMVGSLQGKTGDDADKAFITGMIEHHQGAIRMAELVKTKAKHQEIKDMADDIISAQSKEIEQLQNWQIDWNYPINGGDHCATTCTEGQ